MLLLPGLIWAAQQPAELFKEGKDYAVIHSVGSALPNSGAEKKVIEFFSFGCPACNQFERALENWLHNKPRSVGFDRVPVTFEPGWDILARIYYTAKNLGVADKMAPVIFDAIWRDRQDLTDESNLIKLFNRYGVAREQFKQAFHFETGINAQIMYGNTLMGRYDIDQVPTLVINGKYKTNTAFTQGDTEKLFAVVDYLLKK